MKESLREAWKENLNLIVTKLRELDVELVTLSYDGCGDSGQLDDPYFFAKDEKITKAVDESKETITYKSRFIKYEFVGESYVPSEVESEKVLSLPDAVSELVYDYLDAEQAGCFDDDGAKGDMVLDVITGKVVINHHNVIVDYDSYHFEEEI